jgi:uncharacterized membrane protein
MNQKSESNLLFRVGIVAAFATLAFVGTMIIRIPIPVTGGYFNLGDTFVMVAALLYGPLVGGLVGVIGPAAADAIGFPQFILATAAVKGIEGLIMGLIAKGNQKNKIFPFLAIAAGIGILVAGYYIFEAAIYPAMATHMPFFGVTDAKAALAEIPPNLLQGILSGIVAYGIYRVFTARTKPGSEGLRGGGVEGG